MSKKNASFKRGRKIGYARVSTDKQTLYQYLDALDDAGCDVTYTDDAISAVAANRPGLQEARQALRPGDVFVVLSIDRAFRSAIEGLLFLDALHDEGITFYSIYQQMDTRTPEGRKRFTYDVADAEYERAVISRRTRDKMAAAKRRGLHMGRPHKMTRRKAVNAWRLVSGGMAIERVANKYSVSPVTINRTFKRYGMEGGA